MSNKETECSCGSLKSAMTTTCTNPEPKHDKFFFNPETKEVYNENKEYIGTGKFDTDRLIIYIDDSWPLNKTF